MFDSATIEPSRIYRTIGRGVLEHSTGRADKSKPAYHTTCRSFTCAALKLHSVRTSVQAELVTPLLSHQTPHAMIASQWYYEKAQLSQSLYTSMSYIQAYSCFTLYITVSWLHWLHAQCHWQGTLTHHLQIMCQPPGRMMRQLSLQNR
jgi:hypothetical protein